NGLEAEDAAEQRAEDYRENAARQEQAKDRRSSPVEGADQRQHEPLPDVAEHEAEHQRRDEREHDARVGFRAPRHAEHPGEDLERLRPARVLQKKRRNRAWWVRQQPDETLRAAALEF